MPANIQWMLMRARPPDFSTVYRAEFTYVWASLRRLGVRPADIEDACHELFLVVHRRLTDYDPARPLRPWLFGIAYRIASEFRRRKRRPEVELGEHASDGLAPDAAAEQKERQRFVLRALEVVPLDQRGVLILHDIDEITVPDIAASLAIPLGTAYSRLSAGRKAFAAAAAALRANEVSDG